MAGIQAVGPGRRRIEDEVVEIRQSLENEGKFEIENIGMLFLNEDGNISFEPCEAGILTPDFYGLGGFDMLPIAQIDNGEQQNENQNVAMTVNLAKDEQPVKNEAEAPATPANNSVFIAEEEEEEEKAEFISIKKSWLRNMAASCIRFISLPTILLTSIILKANTSRDWCCMWSKKRLG